MMEPYDTAPDTNDDGRAAIRAAAAISRLDEGLARSGTVCAIARDVLRRASASAMAALEGPPCSPEALAALLVDPDLTDVERSARLARDLHAALSLSEAWSDAGPSPEAVADAFRMSDRSSGRLMRVDQSWTLDDDCAFVAGELERVAETPEPWTGVEAVRRIWTSNRFFGHSRRMALVCAPWAVARGFGCREARVHLAAAVRADPEGFRGAAQSSGQWASTAFVAVASSAADSIRALDDTAALRATMLTLCPPERSSSSVVAAVDLFISRPVHAARSVADTLGLTPRGAKVVLDKLVACGAVDADGGARSRRYVCRRSL